MSFVSVLKAIGHGFLTGINVAEQFKSEIGMIPGVGAPAVSVLNAIAAIEQIFPQSGMGAAKKVAVTALVTAAHPALAATEPAKADLSAAIDAAVAALNSLSTATAKLPAS